MQWKAKAKVLLSCLEWIIQKLTACDKAVLKEDKHLCKIDQDSDSPERPGRLNDSTQALLQAIIWEQDLQDSASHYIADKILHFSHCWQQYISIAAHVLATHRLFQVLTDGKDPPGKEHFGSLHSVSLFPVNNSSSHPLLCASESGLKILQLLLMIV